MLHTRHFGFPLFHFNKFINGKAIFSNWQRFSTIYGRKFSVIQNRNDYQLLFNIPCKNHQFFQRNQFCSGNDGIHPLPVENLNSSSNILSPEMPTNNTIKQEEVLEGTEKGNVEKNEIYFEIRSLEINNKKQLKLKLRKGKSGRKTFNITLIKFGKFSDGPKILIPGDAYAFVRALDELIEELATENFDQKIQIQVRSAIMDAGHQPQHKLRLRTVEMMGQNLKFHLELLLFINNDRRGMMEKEICLGINGVNKITASERKMMLPLKALPWLRKQMARMLAKYDGTEQIANIPPKIPKNFFHLSPSQYPLPHQQQQFYPWQEPLPSATDPAGQQQYYAGIGGPPPPQQYYVDQNMQLWRDWLQARQQQRPQPPTGFPRQQPRQYYVRSQQQQQQMQKRQSQPPPTNPHYPHQQKSEMANENADQFDERSIEEICSEIGDGLTKMQKDLKELNEENGKMKKEIRELKVENEKLNEEMANIWKEIGSGKKKNGTNEWENVEERNSRE